LIYEKRRSTLSTAFDLEMVANQALKYRLESRSQHGSEVRHVMQLPP
jgi:hypothetical protein